VQKGGGGISVPMRMRRLSGLELHFMRRSSSCIRSSDGTSSRLAAISAAGTGRAQIRVRLVGALRSLAVCTGLGWLRWPGGLFGFFSGGWGGDSQNSLLCTSAFGLILRQKKSATVFKKEKEKTFIYS
jgi:hypothetical protein